MEAPQAFSRLALLVACSTWTQLKLVPRLSPAPDSAPSGLGLERSSTRSPRHLSQPGALSAIERRSIPAAPAFLQAKPQLRLLSQLLTESSASAVEF